MESDTNDSFDLIEVFSDHFNYLESTDYWLTSSDSQINPTFDNVNEINDWINSAFSCERSKGCHMTLVNKLDELKLLSPSASINTRTFTRQKRNSHKRESLFNGSALATLYSPEDENELITESTITNGNHNKTFEVQNKQLNDTFTLTTDNTFTLDNDSNIDDVEKMAKIQEENLRQSCSRQRSPPRNHITNFNNRDHRLSHLPNSNHNINSNTLTKNRDSMLRHSTIANALVDDLNHYPMATEDDDHFYYQNGYSPEEFLPSNLVHNSSTPLASRPVRNVNFTRDTNRVVPKIMPNVSNLRAHSYGESKIGRSEPNLSKRFQTYNKAMGNHILKSNNPYGIRSSDNNSTFMESKMPSDSRLVVKNSITRQPLHHQMHNLGRMMSPPPSQTQLQLVGKVSVEGELNRNGTTNLCRKSTFRVREYPNNSEENLRDNAIDLCITNSNPVTNGYQTNKTINNNSKQANIQRNVSKIPGPKNIRSGIPVSGPRTAIPVPANNKLANPTDNSWRNGCF